MNTVSTKRLNGVDVLKFIMAFAVVTIHAHTLFNCDYPASINWSIGLAVPYFFIASGFLTARRLTILDTHRDRIEYLKNRTLRLGKMFLSWLLIYLPISLIAFNYSNIHVLSKDIARYVFNVILTGSSAFAWPLWFLYSSMIAYFILSVLWRYRWGKVSALLLGVSVIAGLLVLPYLILPRQLAYCAKGLFERILGGIPYILTGFLLFKYSRKATNALFVFSLLALSCTAFYFGVSIYPIMGGAAMFLISYMIALPDNGVYNNLNTIGIWIYLTHMFNLLVIKFFLIQTNILPDKYVLLFISFIFVFITSSAINQLSKAKGFAWLKKLI